MLADTRLLVRRNATSFPGSICIFLLSEPGDGDEKHWERGDLYNNCNYFYTT